jgi:hypothetical protein
MIFCEPFRKTIDDLNFKILDLGQKIQLEYWIDGLMLIKIGLNFDGLVTSPDPVTPANAGVQNLLK